MDEMETIELGGVGGYSLYWAVFADNIFEGLFKSLSAAKHLVTELNQYPINWRQRPIIEACDENSEFDKYIGHACRTDAIRAVEFHHLGRKREG